MLKRKLCCFVPDHLLAFKRMKQTRNATPPSARQYAGAMSE
jgi:hypothetical protein